MYLIKLSPYTKIETCKGEDIGNKLVYQVKKASYSNMDLMNGKKRRK